MIETLEAKKATNAKDESVQRFDSFLSEITEWLVITVEDRTKTLLKGRQVSGPR